MSSRFRLLIVLLLLCLAGSAHAQAAKDPLGCAQDAVAAGRADRSPYADEKLQSEADCEQRGVYCVDPTGYPLPGEERDPHLVTGQTLIVKLFGPTACDGILTIGTDVRQSDITLFPEVTPPTAAERELLPSRPQPPPVKLLGKATVKTTATTETVTVVVSRVDTRASINGTELSVTPPRYFLDVGLLVSFTPAFQTVTTSRVPGSAEAFIREEKKLHPSAGVTINYFPAGQYAVPRFSGYHGLGIQAGIGGDLTRLDDEFYLGAIWEPVPGAGISTGVAFMAMERLQPGYPAGALVNPNDVPKDEFLGARWYFGVCLNTQVFETVMQLGGKALVPNQ